MAKKFGVNCGRGGGGGGKNGASKSTNYKNFYMLFWSKSLYLLQIYTFMCNFCSRKGGCASIGVACFYWDIYGMFPSVIIWLYNLITVNSCPGDKSVIGDYRNIQSVGLQCTNLVYYVS